MAKKKEINRFEVLSEAKKAFQFDVGAGGNIYDDALGSNIRGIRLPSVALMWLLDNTCLRDSCIVVIDGETMSGKSSLALDMFNWSMPYGGTGNYIDAENKAPLAKQLLQ